MVRSRRDPQAEADARSPGFVTAIDVAAIEDSRPADDLPRLLNEGAATNVRSLGGLGQFSAVSIRGSSAQQVAFFIDGVPLGQALSGLQNAADLPLDGLDRIEVYRGHLPLAFGAAIGGAVNLVGDLRCRGPVLRAIAGIGSFAGHDARVALRWRHRRVCLSARAGVAGAAGDFDFLDTRGTPQNPDDDRIVRRRNNHYERALGQLGVAARRGRWVLRGRQLVAYKRQGIPGPGAAQSTLSELETLSARTLASAEAEDLLGEGAPLRWVASAGVERRRYRDPLGEVGLGLDDERLLALDAYLSPRLAVPLWRGAVLSMLGEGRGEAVRVDESQATSGASGDARRRRLSAAAGLQLDQRLGGRLSLAPGIRVDALRSRFAVPAGAGEVDDQGRDAATFGASPRLAARLDLTDGLSLRASAGRYFRAPTLVELFGDRGYVIGNEGLLPERGTNLEGGYVYRLGAHAPDHPGEGLDLRVHTAGFWTRSEDLIQWVQTGPVIQPRNLAAALVRGMELGLSASWRRLVAVDANYTLLATRNLSPEASMADRRLPGRPLHQLFARASVGRRFTAAAIGAIEPRFFYTLEVTSGVFLDASERVAVPPRTLHGCGLSVDLAERLRLVVELRNLLDLRTTTWTPPIRGAAPLTVPISDFIGYPLPGRSLWASLRIDLDRPGRDDAAPR